MIMLHSPVKRGFMLNQDSQMEIRELVVRGNENVTIMATGKQGGEELPEGLEVDQASLVELCKRVMVETGTLPRWFFVGVIVDAIHGQLLTYFSSEKDKLFSDIYQDIKDRFDFDLPMADTEAVVKDFFERNEGYRFNFMVIPLEALLAGSAGGMRQQTDIRL